jgi:hypothetical protein
LQHPAPALLLLAACAAPSVTAKSTADTGTTSASTLTTTTGDSGATPTFDAVLPRRVGEAIVQADYLGTEDIQVLPALPNYYYGEPVCVIRLEVTSTGSRPDCQDGGGLPCDWAFDVVFSNAEVLVDTFGLCLEITGFDATTVSALDGTVSTRGYHQDFAGHIPSLMSEVEGGWTRVADALFSEGSGAFSYVWDERIVAL